MADRKLYDRGYAVVTTVASAAAIEVNPTENLEVYKIALGEDATLNIGATAKPVPGDEILVEVSSDATARDLTFGTGITGPVLAGVINKTKTQRFVYTGTGYVASAGPVQID